MSVLNHQNLDELLAAPPDDHAPDPAPLDQDDTPIVDDAPTPPDPDSPQKRNSGKTGPTTPAGRLRASQNSLKHGCCAETLILPDVESEEHWDRLLNRWLAEYQPPEDSLEYDFVYKAAQAEWRRIRAHRNFDDLLRTIGPRSPFNWTPAEIKKHDLHLRYKTTAERTFQREFNTLNQFLKTRRPKPVTLAPAQPQPASAQPLNDPNSVPPALFVTQDPNSPTGYVCLREFPKREDVTYPYPCEPPPNPCPERIRPKPTEGPASGLNLPPNHP